jgi:hypothetical protein
MDSLRIDMSNINLTGSKPADTPEIRITGIERKEQSTADRIDLSGVAKKLSAEINAVRKSDPAQTVKDSSSVIDADYINSLIELGKSVDKKDENIDDLSWGLTVKLGMELGINDADVLRELKVSDVDAYFYEASYKKAGLEAGMKTYGEDGGVKIYDTPSDIWKDMFLTDENGGFIKDDEGNAVRNESFTQARLKVQELNITSQIIQGDTWELGDYKGRLADAPAGLTQNLLLAVKNNDPFMYRYAREHATDRMPVWSAETTAGMSDSEKTDFYTKQLSHSYSLLKSSMVNAPSIEKQMAEIANLLKDAVWENVKPENGYINHFVGSRG